MVDPQQKFEVVDGMITGLTSEGARMCLTAQAAEANGDVMFEPCVCDPHAAEEGTQSCHAPSLQRWELTGEGSIMLVSEPVEQLCLDVKAEQKEDGNYEDWAEISAHEWNELHLYTCHEPGTERVNQLWEWSPIGASELEAILTGTRGDCISEPPVSAPVSALEPVSAPVSAPEPMIAPDPFSAHEQPMSAESPSPANLPPIFAPNQEHHHHHTHPHGSMPENEDEADALAMEGLVDNYQVGQWSASSPEGIFAASAVALATVLIVGLYKFIARRSATPDQTQLLDLCE